MRKILIINIFGIGDVLFTTPLIRNLKLQWPDLFIGYVANRRTAPLMEAHPDVDYVYVYERDEFHSIYQKSKWQYWQKMNEFCSSLKKVRYDCVIDLSFHRYFSFFMWLIGIRVRVGYNYRNRSPLLNRKFLLKGYERRHVVEYYLDLLQKLGCSVKSRRLELSVNDPDEQWADGFSREYQFDRQHRVALVPGGGASWGKDAVYKRWSAERYAFLADKIIEKFSADVILFGDQDEMELCDRIKGLMRQDAVVVGETTLGQFASLLGRCDLAIVNDGGPLHVAVAMEVPTVSIFGPVDENVYGPYPQAGHRVVTRNVACRPCYRQFRRADCDHISCLAQISVEDVFKEVEEVLG